MYLWCVKVFVVSSGTIGREGDSFRTCTYLLEFGTVPLFLSIVPLVQSYSHVSDDYCLSRQYGLLKSSVLQRNVTVTKVKRLI